MLQREDITLDQLERLIAFVQLIYTDSIKEFSKAYQKLTGKKGYCTMYWLKRYGEVFK